MPEPRLILASASPRRQSLLREAGYEFEIDPAEVDESNFSLGALPSHVAASLAQSKAETVAARHPDDVVLGADTIVAFGDRVLGKPIDAEDAKRMLWLLAGTTHLVISGVCIINRNANFQRLFRVMSAVRMRLLNANEIARYVASGEWQGKAGGYGIQDPDPFVTHVSGSKTNVVGLPMSATKKMLAEAGIEPRKG
jgi:septum formation protein